MLDFVWALFALVAAIVFFVFWSVAVGAGWEPTSRDRIRRMLEMSGAGPSDIVYDLGSGDGRIILEAARTYHSRAVGVEADPLRVLFTKLRVSLLHLEGQVRVVWGNLFRTDLSEATIITLFLSQGANQRLKQKLVEELRPGTRVVSHTWTFEGWVPVSRDSHNQLFLYVIQRPAEGRARAQEAL